ncbi:MAG TPA: glycogen/starch/alpha-glucan phosphorylase [Elusimicrobiota bacterium]|nr:glycogen/starch/alpha-glucan phosphorylase [Elusimicrobiota bacterium]
MSQLTIVEVAMEMALTDEILKNIAVKYGSTAAVEAGMSTSVGGIGPLLRERVIVQSEMDCRVIGISLLYRTTWVQGWHAWNHLFLRRNEVADHIRAVLTDTGLILNLKLFDETTIPVKVWKAAYGKADVYFLDAPDVADVVYPCEEDSPPQVGNQHEWAENQRLKQGWLIGRGAFALLKALNVRPDVVIQSETPTFFGNHRLIQDEFQNDPVFENAHYVFNDHTPLEYAHPIWPQSMLDKVKVDKKIYSGYLRGERTRRELDVTRLLVAISDGVFGVAKKHGDVMRAMPSLSDYGKKIESITNGISVPIWQNPLLRDADKKSDEDLIAIKESLKADLVKWLWKRASLWPDWLKAARGKALLLWTRRITSYKRLDMLHQIFQNPRNRERFLKTDILLVVGGRIYQRDNVSEKMVYTLIEMLNRDTELGDRVVFLDNFNIYEAPRLYHAADGAIMLSNDGREASATGFMKAQVNGGAVLANSDGAVPESVAFYGKTAAGMAPNGFEVSYVHGEPDPISFLEALENFDRMYKNPADRVAMVRSALSSVSQVSVERTSQEMLDMFRRICQKPPFQPT